ncbi:Hypothetical predicted protein [Mytilus galloprovincialis]|uniref:MADF domain-containing protein n=1 Tax=Mytilus galloprovincialis TaxID=29158 RepID=A0A8B6BFW3_MYTGA|nr:Hypothetical predicted protein [Mytilus galloprovincialis]
MHTGLHGENGLDPVFAISGRGRGKRYQRKILITLPDNDSDAASNTEYDANILNTQEDIPPQGRPCPPLEPRIENNEIRENPPRAETPIDDEENCRTPIEETPSDNEGNTTEQKSKKQKKSCRLRDDQEEAKVLEWVKEHPILWNNIRIIENLKRWYTDLRDWNTKLHSSRSGDGSKDLTDREKLVMDRFKFLKTNIRHRRAPVKSEALAVARGDLDEAEHEEAEKTIEDPIIGEVRKQFAEAQEDLRSVKSALSVAEPVSERTTFLDWVREVCKNVSDDQFCEFQTSFIQLQNRWKQQKKQQTSPVNTSTSFTASGPSGIRSSCFQPMPSLWRMPPPHLQEVSPWQSQSPEYMQSYMQQTCLNPTTSTSDTPDMISSALRSLNDSETP